MDTLEPVSFLFGLGQDDDWLGKVRLGLLEKASVASPANLT